MTLRHPSGPLAIALIALGAAGATAQDPDDEYSQLVNEYFITQAVYPQEAGELQFTLAPSFGFGDDDRAVFNTALEVGITDRWQFEIEWEPYITMRPGPGGRVSGSGDVEFSTQYSFMGMSGSSTHSALALEVSFPTGDPDKETSEGFIEFEPSLILARDLEISERQAQIFGQVGLGLLRRSKEPTDPDDREPNAHEFTLGAGIATALGPVRLTSEVHWATNSWNNGGDESEVYLTPGLVWDLPSTWELGVGTSFGISDDAQGFQLLLFGLYEIELNDER